MFNRSNLKRRNKDEGEKPFWISYSDLMTATMTLFLVVMAVTIVSLGKENEEKAERGEAIENCFKEIKEEARRFPQAKVELGSSDAIRIDLGSIVNFETNKYDVSPQGVHFLKTYIPSVLNSVKSTSCQKYFRRVVVEGYTDTNGDYLPNLILSLKRSGAVVCALSSSNIVNDAQLSKEQLKEIRDLFMVGGVSFNSFKKTHNESRRAELKLEFWQVNEKKDFSERYSEIDLLNKDFGTLCPL